MCFNARIGDVSGGGKLASDMREIWMMQPRFEKRVGSTPFGLVEQPRFRAAFDFMRLRAEGDTGGEVDEVLADWWQEFSMADEPRRCGTSGDPGTLGARCLAGHTIGATVQPVPFSAARGERAGIHQCGRSGADASDSA
jgi:hypothetical protein